MEQLIHALYPQAEILSFNNGLPAMQCMTENPADIIFSDIRMPHMTGLELAEQIHTMCPKTVVILISAYAEFEYAQKAISLHVFEYLVKPILPVKVQEVLLRAIDYLNTLDTLTHQADNFAGTPAKTWEWLMLHDYDQITSAHVYRLLESGTDGRFVYIDIPDIPEYTSDDLKEVFENLKYWFEKILFSNAIVCALTKHNHIRIDAFLYQKFLSMKAVRQFQQTARSDYRLELNILISRFHMQIGDHWNEVQQDISTLKTLLFYHPSDAVLVCDAIPPPSSKSLFCPENQYDVLTQDIWAYNNEHAVQICGLILDGFSSANVPPDSFKEAASHLMMKLFESFFSVNQTDSSALDHTLSDIRTSRSSADVKKVVANTVANLCNTVRQFQREAKPIQKVIRFVNENFDKKIALSDAAELCHYSVSHFSVMFKMHTGKNFVAYLNAVRLNHVLRLISTTDLTINEVALRTGFSDVNYLNRLFKREYGMTVQTYRDRLR